MSEGTTPDPFAIFDQVTSARAEQDKDKTELMEVGVDQIRVRHDRERRERLGQLRAREHPSKRPDQATPVFGHTPLN